MGQPIGSRYELQSQLGRGAFGSVWRGRVRDTGEAVAIKVLLEELANDADVVTRFLRERTALVSMRHRSLVSVRDLVVEGDLLALVMQLVEGPDLRAYLRGRGTLGAAEAALLVADVAEALAVAHAAKIIHRDVKPANVLLHPEDGGYRPLLTDFGIARLADAPSVTRTSQVVGTPYYLAPEVISGQQPTPAVDVYACGIMFFELRTGRPPFRGNDAMEVFQAHQTQPPPRPEGVPDALWSVIASALAKDPSRRPDAAALASRLRAAVKASDPGAAALVPVHPREGTVVLPKLPGEPAPVAPSPVTPGRTPAAVAAAAAAPTRPIPASYGAAAAAAAAPAAPTHVTPKPKPSGYPPQPVFPGPQLPPAHNNVPPRGAYAPQGGSAYRPPQQAPQQRIVQPQPQRRVDAPPPLRQAPRQPRPGAAYDPLPKSGIGCLGKLAILLIVLALAALIGVEIGNRIARNHNNPMNNRSGVSIIVPWNGFGGSSH
ncbi:serine/threonine-protein kinase [Actinospica robiniae]|uniref:serine/threonine-protein kinase n=1 Tax=Actinospica robiniae TaxID=304901 RepID=UPI00040054B2|nr:serine/threonine-protein kinase [Actinospica robiniae]